MKEELRDELDKLVWDFKEKTGMKSDAEIVFGNVHLVPDCQELNTQHLGMISRFIENTFKNDNPKNFVHLRPTVKIINGNHSRYMALVIPKGLVEMTYKEPDTQVVR